MKKIFNFMMTGMKMETMKKIIYKQKRKNKKKKVKIIMMKKKMKKKQKKKKMKQMKIGARMNQLIKIIIISIIKIKIIRNWSISSISPVSNERAEDSFACVREWRI